MDLSIIISVCNEMPHLLYTIQALQEELEGFYNYEIIVVDNISTDGIEEFFKQNLDKKIKYIKYEGKKSHWCAKNEGVKIAIGRNLFFIDAHCIIGRDSLRNLMNFADNYKGNLGGAHCYHHPMLMRYRKFEHHPRKKFFFRFRRGQEKTEPYEVAHMTTCGMLCPKSVFDELGGWNKNFGTRWGGEAYMNLKHAICGYPHYIIPDAHYYHCKHDYGYTFDVKEGYQNLMIAAYCIGGEEWLNYTVEEFVNKKKIKERPCFYDDLANKIRTTCKEDRDFIKSKQKISLSEFYEKWSVV